MQVVREDLSSLVYGTERRFLRPELSKGTRGVLMRPGGLVSVGMEFGFILQ